MSAPGTTPGPWEVQTPMGDNAPWIVRAGLQSYEWEPIATLGDEFVTNTAQKRIMADANLMGASQALYDALAAELADLMIDRSWAETSDLDRLIQRCERIERALAQASPRPKGKPYEQR